MSTYKQIVRSRSNRMLGGVCAGLGEYLGIDPTIIRLVFVLVSLLGHLPVVGVVYLVLLIVVPEEADAQASEQTSELPVPPSDPPAAPQE